QQFSGTSKSNSTVSNLNQVIEYQNQILHQLRSENQELRYLANSDELTQLANRRRFYSYLSEVWEKCDSQSLSVILCDVDSFKTYNDNYGHLAGDLTLKQIAEATQNAVQEMLPSHSFLVARYGGEELAVILPSLNVKQALTVAERIRLKVSELKIPHLYSKASNIVTMSLGIASRQPSESVSPLELLRNADCALYKAKSLGRDRVVCSQQRDESKTRNFCSCQEKA
ncbi:MAG: diguanylate cyclase, partial [Cyanobacteriota bacterium]|nr:diguanylate cyclase [Cyanobacteriota bacterium]